MIHLAGFHRTLRRLLEKPYLHRLWGPPWFRRFMWCWDVYWSDDPFVWWGDVKDLCARLTQTEQQLADMTADYHRWHDAFMDLKYPGGGPPPFPGTQSSGEVKP